MGIVTPETLTITETLSLKEPAPKRQYPGALVVVEGIDGSGKSTQLYLLKRWLEIGGYRIHFTEWNSSPLVRSATRRGKQRRLLTPTTFSLLHAADFADRCERQIMPLLHGGYLVLADRYIYTAFARDAARGYRALSPRFDPKGLFARIITANGIDERQTPELMLGYARVINAVAAAARASRPKAGLTPAELRVLRALPAGTTLNRIASEFGKSPKTVERQVQSIYGKLHVSNRAQAVQRARELGIYA